MSKETSVSAASYFPALAKRRTSGTPVCVCCPCSPSTNTLCCFQEMAPTERAPSQRASRLLTPRELPHWALLGAPLTQPQTWLACPARLTPPDSPFRDEGRRGRDEIHLPAQASSSAWKPPAPPHSCSPGEGLCRWTPHPTHSSLTRRIYPRFYSHQHNLSFQATLIRWTRPRCFNPLPLILQLFATLLLFTLLLL